MERKLTEKEKLRLGESFNPEGKELINQRTIAHGLCAEYNAASEQDEARRKDMLNCLLGELGRDAFIQGPIQLDYGFRTFIGDRTYINFRVIGKNLGFLRFLDIIFLCQSTTPPLAPAQQGGDDATCTAAGSFVQINTLADINLYIHRILIY